MHLFKFGLIADVQYADIPNGMNYKKTVNRYYRESFFNLAKACSEFSRKDVNFVLQLGDFIDGHNSRMTPSQSDVALAKCLSLFRDNNLNVYHTIGNHECYNYTRSKLQDKLFSEIPLSNSSFFYYTFRPYPGYCFVCLDTYDLSIIGNDSDHHNFEKSLTLLRSKNPNKDLNSSENMSGPDRRYRAYNGGLSDAQLSWLDIILDECDQKGERVFVFAHGGVFLPATHGGELVWNCEDVINTLHRHSSVRAYFNGHDHSGGRAIDDKGIYHLTLPACLEADNRYAIATIYIDRVEVTGYGDIDNWIIPLDISGVKL